MAILEVMTCYPTGIVFEPWEWWMTAILVVYTLALVLHLIFGDHEDWGYE